MGPTFFGVHTTAHDSFRAHVPCTHPLRHVYICIARLVTAHATTSPPPERWENGGMSDRIEALIAEALGDVCTGFIGAHKILAALKAARIAVVELPETQTDPEWGDEFWQVPSDYDKYPGKLRIETGYRDGVPRISHVSIPTPMPTTTVDAYVSALLAAKAAAEVSQ